MLRRGSDLGGDAAGTCGVGSDRVVAEKAFFAKLEKLSGAARIGSHELTHQVKLVSVHATHVQPATTPPLCLRLVRLLALEEGAMPDAPTRFIALDVHKAYVVIGAGGACAGYLRHMLSIRNAAVSFE